MVLNSINDKLVQNLQRSQIGQLMSITKILGLKVGSQFLADVQKVTQATPEERAQLVKSIEANLVLLNKNSAAPAIKALISALEAQKNMAQSPGVKLVTLAVNAPVTTLATTNPNVPPTTIQPTSAITTLLTYTNQPIQIGQTLLMQLGEGQRLQLIQPLTQAEIASFNAKVQAGNVAITAPDPLQANTYSPKTNALNPSPFATSSLFDNGNINDENASAVVAQNKRAAIKATEVVGEALRRLLPQQDTRLDLLTNLPKIIRFIQQLPHAERNEWLSSQVQQSLRNLTHHIRLTDQLNNPTLVEMTLKNNGQNFEHKLAQLVSGKHTSEPVSPLSTSAPLAQKNTPPSPPTLVNPAATANSALSTINSPPGVNNKPAESAQNPVEKIATQDLKGALLGLLHQLDTEVESAKTALAGSPLGTEINKPVLTIPLPQFLAMLTHKQQGELSQKQLRTQLVMLLHQYTLGSIAKIQLQQVNTLNHQLSQTDQTQPTQSWQFEIPVRQGHEVHPLHIQLEQQWVDEQNENAKKRNARVRQWNLMLSFDLPVIGQFYAQLMLLGDTLSAKFWAKNEDTLSDAKKRIDGLTQQLEREGIQVSQIQCVLGVPPKPKMSVSYSLVDVKT